MEALLSILVAFAPLPPEGVDFVHIVSRPMLASTLIGIPVREADGAQVGFVRNLVFDVRGNKVMHAVLALDDGAATVPLFDLRLSLQRAYVSLRPKRENVAPAAPAPNAPSARTWIGAPVQGRGATPLGRVADVLVDVHEGDVPFVLLERDNVLHPVPLDALRAQAEGLRLAIDPAKLDPAHGFSAGALARNLEEDEFLTRHAEYADRLTAAPGTAGANASPTH